MAYSSLFGTFTSRGEVVAAVDATLRTWMLTYLAEVERQEGLAPKSILPPGSNFPEPFSAVYPPESSSFRSGLDFETWRGEQAPLLIVVCEPFGEPERYDAGKYLQAYEIQVGAVCEDPNGQEWTVEQLADRYGKALMGLLTQQGGLGTRVDSDGSTVPFSEKTVLVGAPKTEFVDPSRRNLARSVVTVHAFVEAITDESQGPRVPPPDPYAEPGNWPTASEVTISVETEDTLGVVHPGTGVSLLPVGGVTITE